MKTKVVSALLLTLPLLSSAGFGQSPYEHRNRGLAVGGLMGALTGGAIGHHNGETAEGALIGAGVGALAGALIGDSVDNDIARNNAYAQRYAQQQYARQASAAVSVQDAIAMSQAKLSDSVIMTHIQANGVVARPESGDLIVMRNAGVSDAVIQVMQTARVATALPPPQPAYRGVVVERHYVAPVYPPPVWHHWHYDPYCRPHHGHYYRPGVHWGVTIGH